MKTHRFAIICALVILFGLSAASAQPDKDWKTLFGHFAGGYSMVEGDAGDLLKSGWNLNGGVTLKQPAWPVALQFELGYNQFDIKKEALIVDDEEIASGGDVSIGSLTSGLMWSAPSKGKVGFFLAAGVGGYRVEGRLTEPGVYGGWVCDPWLWWCYPGIGVGDVIVASESTTKFGYNAGVGVTFELPSSSQLYIEAKYHWINTKETTQYLPIVIGYRW